MNFVAVAIVSAIVLGHPLNGNVHEDLPSSLFIQKLAIFEIENQPRLYALNCDKGQILLQTQEIWNS